MRTLDIDVVAAIDTWLWLGEDDSELMARECSSFGMDRANWRIGGGAQILVAGNCEAQEGPNLHIKNMQALEVVIRTGGSKFSVVDKHSNSRWKQV